MKRRRMIVGAVPLPRVPTGLRSCSRKRQVVNLLQLYFFIILTLFTLSDITDAQQPKKIPRMCFLTFDPGTLLTRSPRFNGFFQGLEDLSYVNGNNIEINYLSADNNGGRFPALIDECLS